MLHLDDDPNRDELDDFVRAFEQAYSRDGHAEIAKFLPPRDHPLYATVLCELIRLDLEFGWEQGCPKTLSEYQRVFPELQRDREALRAIAFEEDRVRRLAEESLSPNRSRRRDAGILGKGIGRLPREGAPGQHARRRLSDGLERIDPGDPSVGDDDDGQSRRDGVERAQGLRITIAKLGYMGSFVSRSNPDFCRTVLRLSDSVVTNTAHCYLRHII
jgi:hypothetical protein